MPEVFEWDTTEYEHKDRSSDWFWAIGIVCGALALAAIFFNDVLLGIVILIGGFTIMLLNAKRPQVLHITVSSRGIRIKNDLYPFQNLKSFWIDEDAPIPTLTIPTHKLLNPHLRLGLEGVDPLELQSFLLRYMKEEYQPPTLVEVLVHYFGF